MAKSNKLILGTIFIEKETDPCCANNEFFVEDSPSIAFVGTGTQSNPLTGNVQVSLQSNNTLTIQSDGLYVSGSLLDTSANNGLSVNAGVAVLGQDVGDVSNPAILINNREIPMAGFTLAFNAGLLRVNANTGTSTPVIINNAFAGASENLRLTGDLASMRLMANTTAGFAATTYYANGIIRGSVGYDGPNDHFFMADVRNTPGATWEINGVTIGGYATATANFWFGDGVVTDDGRVNIDKKATGQTASSKVLRVANTSSTFNTTAGVLSSWAGHFTANATRSAGGSNLTNIGVYAAASGAQRNYAFYTDTGDVYITSPGGFLTSTGTIVNMVDLHHSTTASVATDKQYMLWAERDIIYDNDGLTPPGNFGALIRNNHFASASVTIIDSARAGAEIGLLLRKTSGFVGTTTFTGSTNITNNVTTTPSALVSRLDFAQSLTGGNPLVAVGYWSSLSAIVNMSAGNTVDNAIWINTGTGQLSAGAITNGYSIYINPHTSIVTNKYAIYQEGTGDLNVFFGGTIFGAATKNASAKVQIDSTTQGFLPPRMTTVQRDAIASPVAGLVVYNTSTNKLNVFTTVWETITSI